MDLKALIASKLATLAPQVTEAAIMVLAEAEHQRRVKAFTAAVQQVIDTERELKKIERPDQILYGADGKPTQEGYSKTRLDDIAKKKAQIAKIIKALEAADGAHDFSQLLNLAGSDKPAD